VKTYTFTLQPGRLYNGTATLVWNRPEGQSSINNLNLSLFRVGETSPVDSSLSPVDNVEHLFFQALSEGTYDLKVERVNDAVSGEEPYAVAFNFTALPTVVSRKTHAGAGSFDVPLPLAGTPGVECRSGGANDAHQIVFSFPNSVTLSSAAVFWSDAMGSGTGNAIVSGGGTTTITVNVSRGNVGDPPPALNAHLITVALYGVNDGTNISDVGVKMGVLLGDTNGDGTVNSGDSQQTRNRSGQEAAVGNFRSDVNIDGLVNSGDAQVVNSRSGNTIYY
jgi:hypothetical protein